MDSRLAETGPFPGDTLDTFEKIAYQEGYQLIAGIDEAGRGPLAGPVVAAAVIFPPDYVNTEINDSKQLSARKREELYEIIKSEAVAIGMGIVDADIIDRLNILRATLQAMREAVLELSTSPDFLLIDGLQCIPLLTPQKPLVKGTPAAFLSPRHQLLPKYPATGLWKCIIANFLSIISCKTRVMELKNTAALLNNLACAKFIVNHFMSKI